MPNSLKNYFSPKETKHPGRPLKRSLSSPENINKVIKKHQSLFEEPNMGTPKKGSDEIGKMSMDKVMASFSALLDSKNYATKSDLTLIEETIKVVKEENVLMKKEIEILKVKDARGESQLNNLENYVKRKNLIFRGLDVKNDSDYKDQVSLFCQEVLGIEERKLDLIEAHPIGRKTEKNNVIIAYFSTYLATVSILKRTSRLKGTLFVVHRDYSYGTRMRRAKLSVIKKEVQRLNNNLKVSLLGDRMAIERHIFDWDDTKGLLYNNCEDGVKKLMDIFHLDLKSTVLRMTSKPDQRDANLRGVAEAMETRS